MPSEWKGLGTITVEQGKLVPPQVPMQPGLYRLSFDDGSVYIGEANDLCRRIGDYLKYYPSVGIESEFRINKKLLDSKIGTALAVLVGGEFSTHSQRCVREHHEIKIARAEGGPVINGGTIEDHIVFFESEIKRLREKLRIKRQLEEGQL